MVFECLYIFFSLDDDYGFKNTTDQVLGSKFVWEVMGRRSNTIIKAGNENYSFLICNFENFPSCDRNDAEPL